MKIFAIGHKKTVFVLPDSLENLGRRPTKTRLPTGGPHSKTPRRARKLPHLRDRKNHSGVIDRSEPRVVGGEQDLWVGSCLLTLLQLQQPPAVDRRGST